MITVYGTVKPSKQESLSAIKSRQLHVVRRVRSLVRSGSVVLFVGRQFKSIRRYGSVKKYSQRVRDVRISRSGVVVQVLLGSDWSSVWDSERLITETGEVLYESFDFEELERQLTQYTYEQMLTEFFSEFGVLPFKKAA